MSSLCISLEALEYSLIKYKCEFLYGFKDQFLKYDKNDIFIRFGKIADGLESQKLISRSFSGDITYDEEYKKILEIIINVEKFYEVSYIVNGFIKKKYRIYNVNNNNVVIKISSNEENELDYHNLDISLVSDDNLNCGFEKFCDLEKINPSSNVLKDTISVCNDYLVKIKKNKSEDFSKIFNEFSYNTNELMNKLNKIIRNHVKFISVLKTNMKTRKSKVRNYIYDLSSLIKMDFKIQGEIHNWVINELSKDLLNDEFKQIIEM